MSEKDSGKYDIYFRYVLVHMRRVIFVITCFRFTLKAILFAALFGGFVTVHSLLSHDFEVSCEYVSF